MKLKAALLAATISTSSFATALMPEAECSANVDGQLIQLSVHVNGEVNYCGDEMDPNVAITMTSELVESGEEGMSETHVVLGTMNVETGENGESIVTVKPTGGPEGASFVYTIDGVPGEGIGTLTSPAEPEYDIEEEIITFQCEFPSYHMECHLDM